MLDDSATLQRLLVEAQENLALIQEREAQYVLSTEIPLQLVKEERRLAMKIRWLERRIVEFKPINVLRHATKLITGPLAEVLTGEPDNALNKRLLDRASLLPHSRYLDVAALETSIDDMVRLMEELEILLRAYRLEPNVDARHALERHTAPLVDIVRRVYQLTSD